MSDLLIIGHRGAPAAAPENTLPSFLLAAQTGAQMVELDVHLSKDGKVVVIHDEMLNRTTSGTGPVMARTLASLKRLDAGTAFSPQFAGTKIPSLEEVFTSLPRRIGLNIELKTNIVNYPGLEAKVLSIVNRHRAQQRVIVSSFNWSSLNTLHRLEPQLRLGLLFNRLQPDLWAQASLLNAFSLHPALACTSSQLIWQSHSWGYRVFPWVVNNPAQVVELKTAGVDGVITDCPQAILQAME